VPPSWSIATLLIDEGRPRRAALHALPRGAAGALNYQLDAAISHDFLMELVTRRDFHANVLVSAARERCCVGEFYLKDDSTFATIVVEQPWSRSSFLSSTDLTSKCSTIGVRIASRMFLERWISSAISSLRPPSSISRRRAPAQRRRSAERRFVLLNTSGPRNYLYRAELIFELEQTEAIALLVVRRFRSSTTPRASTTGAVVLRLDSPSTSASAKSLSLLSVPESG